MARKIEYGRMLHGGDYNPEQWLDRPDILKKDIEYFKKAHINTVSVGIFSWAVLEPEEGKYNLGWLEEIIDNLYKEGISTILATPSGARPKWMADKYPEVLRMDPDRTRRFFGGRHNHCYTSRRAPARTVPHRHRPARPPVPRRRAAPPPATAAPRCARRAAAFPC